MADVVTPKEQRTNFSLFLPYARLQDAIRAD
jgi:hypothetical protein